MANLVLKDIGKNKVKVIKILCEVTGVSLKEAKDIVEGVRDGKEYTITNIPEENVQTVLDRFMQAGACIDVMEGDDAGEINANCVPKSDEGPRDDKNIFAGFIMSLKADIKKLKDLWNAARTTKDFQTVVAAISIFLIIGICVLFVLGIIGNILTTPSLLLGLIVLCYFLYQRFGATLIVYTLYESTSNKLQLPDGMNSQSMLEALEGKFDYPYFEEIQCGENGECIIKGKYAECQVIFNSDGITYLSCKEIKQADLKFYNNLDQRLREGFLEIMAIRSYMNKFFNPTMTTNAARDFNRLKSMEKQEKLLSPALSYCAAVICLIICLKVFFPNVFQYITSPGREVRGAYLSKYSTEVTIGEAFDNYFDKGKWRKYKADDGYKYVAFTGTCDYSGRTTDVRITFKITGDNAVIDRVELNGQEQNGLVEIALLLDIYSGY